MNFKPNEFFIGLVEFITILLPGAVLAVIFLFVEHTNPVQTDKPLLQYALDEKFVVIFWVAFIFCAFGLGYFLSSIASGLDPLYDVIRKQTYPYEEDLRKHFNALKAEKQAKYLAVYERWQSDDRAEHSGSLSDDEKRYQGFKFAFAHNFFRRLLGLIFKLEFMIRIDNSYEETRKLLDAQPAAVRRATNAFKWAGTVLEAHYPTINEEATRMMAASKFFRSMVVVTLLYLVLQVTGQLPWSFWQINILVLVLSFREYIVQRQKSVLKTYQSLVTLSYFKKEG